MRLFWVWLIVHPSLSAITVPLNRLKIDKNMSLLVSLKDGFVTIFVQLEHEGYLSLGLAKGMESGIVFLIQFQNGNPTMSDCQMIGNRRPRCSRPINPIYNLDDFEKLKTGGWRAIIRADINSDFEVPVREDVNQFSAAYGFSPLLAYHGPGEGVAKSFKSAFITPIFVMPTNTTNSTNPTNSTNSSNSTNSTNSTDSSGENQNTTIPVNQTDGIEPNSTDSENNIELPSVEDSDPTNTTSKPIVRTINPSRYKIKEYRLNASLFGLSMLWAFLALGFEM